MLLFPFEGRAVFPVLLAVAATVGVADFGTGAASKAAVGSSFFFSSERKSRRCFQMTPSDVRAAFSCGASPSAHRTRDVSEKKLYVMPESLFIRQIVGPPSVVMASRAEGGGDSVVSATGSSAAEIMGSGIADSMRCSGGAVTDLAGLTVGADCPLLPSNCSSCSRLSKAMGSSPVLLSSHGALTSCMVISPTFVSVEYAALESLPAG